MTNASDRAVEKISPHGFADTLSRLETAILKAGLRIFGRIDHAEGAREFGLDMPPTLVLLYGHPRGGTPIMQAYPDAALDLPLKLLVRENADGSTSVLFRPIADILEPAGVPVELALRLAPAQNMIAAAIGAMPDDR